MSSFNRIAIVGYLGRDPELRYTQEGTPVCNFSVATTEKRKDKAGDLQEITTWFQVALFGRQAENVKEYLAKGSHVWLEGSLQLNQWNHGDGAPALILMLGPLTSNSSLAQARNPHSPQPRPRLLRTISDSDAGARASIRDTTVYSRWPPFHFSRVRASPTRTRDDTTKEWIAGRDTGLMASFPFGFRPTISLSRRSFH